MNIKRKRQLTAALVVANSVLALTVLTTRPALANPCSTFTACGLAVGFCPQNATSFCNARAPAGCTVTSFTCNGNDICANEGIPIETVTCNFA
jgi:Pyruvate/2-oxoacid:ferredoxin oxidoreductase delta subunit